MQINFLEIYRITVTNILDIAVYFQVECINMQCCNSCSVISGYTSLGKYYLDVAVPNSKVALTLESLLYNAFFSSLNQCSERLRCESCNSIEAHEVMICRNAPPVLNETIMLKILIQHQFAFL